MKNKINNGKLSHFKLSRKWHNEALTNFVSIIERGKTEISRTSHQGFPNLHFSANLMNIIVVFITTILLWEIQWRLLTSDSEIADCILLRGLAHLSKHLAQ